MPPRKTAKKRTAKKVARNVVKVGKWEMPDCVEYELGQVVWQGEYKAHITGILFTPAGHLYLIRFQEGEGDEVKAYGFELKTEQEYK